jgi:hypothetical protein
MATANVVFSGPADIVAPLIEEAIIASGQTIKPGNLVIKSSGQYIVHGTAGVGGAYRIANLDVIRNGRVTDTLVAGDTCQAFIPRPGESYNVIVGASQTIAIDSPLTSNANGTLKLATITGATPDVVLFYAEEAVTTGSGVTARILARVATAGHKATA